MVYINKTIVFSKILDVALDYAPIPTSKNLPEWYRKTDSYVGGLKTVNYDLSTNQSIKKCVPVFDALTAGYIIPTYCDLVVKKTENGQFVYLTSGPTNIEFHSTEQSPYHPYMNNHAYPKWMNPWGIKTPKGYSCLFIPPVHGGNLYFEIMEGIVDTDKYTNPVNFPFVLKDINFEGTIPAGTPMVQVIPFKRDSWQMQMGTQKDIEQSLENNKLLQSKFFDRYKTIFWDRKNYK